MKRVRVKRGGRGECFAVSIRFFIKTARLSPSYFTSTFCLISLASPQHKVPMLRKGKKGKKRKEKKRTSRC